MALRRVRMLAKSEIVKIACRQQHEEEYMNPSILTSWEPKPQQSKAAEYFLGMPLIYMMLLLTK
jgi:hypothetical protein